MVEPESHFRVSDVCSGRLVFLDQPVQEKRWRLRASAAVGRVKEASLVEIRDACLAAINK
jgi:hypothetical protein